MTTDRDFRGRSAASRSILAGLGAMTYEEVVEELGEPDTIATRYSSAPGSGWTEGVGKPSLASDDPAVVQAMGRCATNRQMRGPVGSSLPDGASLNEGSLHPKVCNWCAYPLPELLLALGWAVMSSAYVVTEYATWKGKYGSHYERPTPREGTYLNRRWREFFATEPILGEARRRRREAIADAMYGE